MTESSTSPLSGLYKPTSLQRLHYGPASVEDHLLSALPSSTSRAFIITGNSLATKTPVIKEVEALLGKKHLAGTFSNIKAHAPVVQLDEATSMITKDSSIDTIISIGGGSPIDSAKAISFRINEQSGHFLHHIAVPTTLSAAECSCNAGYTDKDGQKIGVADIRCAPAVIIYDATFAKHTPMKLWLSTGIRALDHAVELLYHPTASEIPCKQMCLSAINGLFSGLRACRQDPKDIDNITKVQLASYASLGFLGTNVQSGLGLSHALGYALGSPYGIPHGITSCITLAGVVRIKAKDPKSAIEIARAIQATGGTKTESPAHDARCVADALDRLVHELGLESRLREYGVGADQVPVVAKKASGGSDSGLLYDAITAMVESKL